MKFPSWRNVISQAHLRHGIKTGLAAILAYAVVHGFGLQHGFWAVLSAVIVMQINVADSVRLCWYRLTGTALGAVIGIVTILVFPEPGWMTGLGLFLAVGFCAYMTRYNPRFHMAAITVVIIVVAGLEEDQRVVFGLYRILEIALGVGSAFLVTVLVWPRRAGTTLKEQLRGHYGEAAHCHEILVEAFLSRQTSVDAHLLDGLQDKAASARELLSKAIRHERLLSSEDPTALGRRVSALENCVEHMRAMQHVLNDFEEGQGYDIIMADQVRTLARAVKDVLLATGAGREPALDHLEAALQGFEQRLEELRKAGVTKRFNLNKLLQVFSFLHAMQYMAKGLLKTRKE